MEREHCRAVRSNSPLAHASLWVWDSVVANRFGNILDDAGDCRADSSRNPGRHRQVTSTPASASYSLDHALILSVLGKTAAALTASRTRKLASRLLVCA